MKRLLQSDFVAQYGMLFVLLLLGAYFSFATLDEQYQVSPSAARVIARYLLDEHPTANVVIVVPAGVENERFAEVLQEAIAQSQITVVDAIAGTPTDAARRLRALGNDGRRVDFIATQYAAARWPALTTRGIGTLTAEFPSWKGVAVIQPATYVWPTFLTTGNLLAVANQVALIAIVAIGMTFVIITGGIDLSVGSLIALAGVFTGVTLQRLSSVPPTSAMLLGAAIASIIMCGGMGLFTGIMVTTFRVPAFIVTLALMQVARGLAYKLAGGPSPLRIDSEVFHHFSAGSDLFGIPNPVTLMLALYLAAHVVMSRTALGRYIYAVGGNAEAARLSGVPVQRVLLFAYLMCGALAGLGGVMDASLFRSARATGALGYELQIIAAVVVGGTSLAGGEGRVLGTLIGALILGVIQNGMSLTKVDPYTQMVVFGVLILGAVLLDKWKTHTWRPT